MGDAENKMVLHVVDNLIPCHAPAPAAENIEKKAADVFFAVIAATFADLDPRVVIGEQVCQFIEHAAVDEIAVGILQALYFILIL